MEQTQSLFHACPLCGTEEPEAYFRDQNRAYVQCTGCKLVYVPRCFHLSPEEEKAEYDKHQNDLNDDGYRRFLSRLFEPLQEHLISQGRRHAKGLDFGCGPGPLLAEMFREQRHSMHVYDHFYAPHAEVLEMDYDFITCTETVEHLSQPGEVLEQLWQQILPGGWLGLMTKRVIDQQTFANWHYRHDPTHICFFSDQSFRWLQRRWQCELEFIGKDVMIFHKVACQSGQR